MRSRPILVSALAASMALACSGRDLDFGQPTPVVTEQPPSGGIFNSAVALPQPVNLAIAGDTILLSTGTEVMTFSLGRAPPTFRPVSEPVVGVATDGRFAFWIDRDGVIFMLDLATNVISLFTMGRGPPGGIAIDETNVYWTANTGLYAMPRIASSVISGGFPIELASGFDRVGRVVAAGGSVVFVGYDAESPNGRLIRLPISGDLPNTVAEGAFSLGSVATDGTWAFWTVFRVEKLTSTPQGGVFRAALRGGEIKSLSGLVGSPGEVVVVGQHLYFYEGVLQRITINGEFDNWMPIGPMDCYAVSERNLVWVKSNAAGWALMVNDLRPLP